MTDKPSPAGERSHWLQVVLAVIGVVGTLGVALFANWDKVFGPAPKGAAAPPSAASTQGAQSPVVSGVGGNVTIQIGAEPASRPPPAAIEGRWVGSELVNPYDRVTVSTLTLDLQVVGDTVVGSVTEHFPSTDGERRYSRPLVEGRVAGNRIVFETHHQITGGASGTQPMRERYVGTFVDGRIDFSRQNDSPGGGAVQTFVARRP
jgi:hypothetical protein